MNCGSTCSDAVRWHGEGDTPPPATAHGLRRAPLIVVKLLTRCTASYLEPLKGGKVPVEILIRGKDADENKKQFEKCLDIIKKAGKKVAVLKKDNASGGFAEEWKAAFGEAGIKDEDQIELGPILSHAAMSIKDAKELVRPRATLFRLTGTDKLAATHPRCVARIERRHEQLLRRRDVRNPRF